MTNSVPGNQNPKILSNQGDFGRKQMKKNLALNGAEDIVFRIAEMW